MQTRITIFSDNELDEFLDDPIAYTYIKKPVITPDGHTIDYDSIMACKVQNNNDDLENQVELIDPLSRGILFSCDLIPNHLFGKIREVLLSQRLDVNQLLYYLRDPISGDFFTLPIVADDGETYDYHHLKEWLKKYNNELPSGVKQINPLDVETARYKNLFITSLLTNSRIRELMFIELEKPPILDSYAQVCIDGLQAYIDMRVFEPQYAGHKCGYAKNVKLQAALDAKHTLEGKLNPYTLFAPQATQKIKALKQGRLKEYGNQTVEIIRQNVR